MPYRVFYPQSDADKLPAGTEVTEQYPAFGIVNADAAAIDELRKRYPVEELVPPQAPQAVPEVAGLAAAVEEKSKGPYTLVVRFRAPVRQEWIDEIATTGCQYLEPIGSSTVVVRCANKRDRSKLEKLTSVTSITTYVPVIVISPDFFDNLGVDVDEKALAQALETLGNKPPDQGGPSRAGGLTLHGVLLATFFLATDQQAATRSLPRKGVRQISVLNETDLVIDLTTTKEPVAAILAIAQRPGLRSVRPKALDITYNDIARTAIADRVITMPPLGLGLTGAGEVIAVADTGLDTGDVANIHPDFRGRIRQIHSFPFSTSWQLRIKNTAMNDGAADQYSGHGTHVCGSIVGDGTRANALGLKETIQGVAPKAELVFQAVEQKAEWNKQGEIFWALTAQQLPPSHGLFGIPDDLRILFEAAYDQGARIHSNSWGGGVLGAYNDNSRNLDDFVWNHKDFLVVVAAGNEANHTNPPSLQSVISPGTAKNCLTVGACESSRNGGVIDRMAEFSGRGPCSSGRRKPDIVAPGTFIVSTRSSQIPADQIGWGKFGEAEQDYMLMGGTSMATPLVAGCVAVTRQYLRQFKQITKPTAALLKAILIHAAQYHKWDGANAESAPWADHEQGWGRIDLQRVLNPAAPTTVHFIDDTAGLATGTERLYRVQVTDDTVPLRLTLVYSDFAGQDLINNLNLFANQPGGGFWVGNDFQRTGSPDGDNNVEGIIVEQPPLGEWIVRVVASNIPQGPQDFALVISGGGVQLL
ncbi:MAG: S8 family serine peptidase [Caldilineaceae bacterium]